MIHFKAVFDDVQRLLFCYNKCTVVREVEEDGTHFLFVAFNIIVSDPFYCVVLSSVAQ